MARAKSGKRRKHFAPLYVEEAGVRHYAIRDVLTDEKTGPVTRDGSAGADILLDPCNARFVPQQFGGGFQRSSRAGGRFTNFPIRNPRTRVRVAGKRFRLTVESLPCAV